MLDMPKICNVPGFAESHNLMLHYATTAGQHSLSEPASAGVCVVVHACGNFKGFHPSRARERKKKRRYAGQLYVDPSGMPIVSFIRLRARQFGQPGLVDNGIELLS